MVGMLSIGNNTDHHNSIAHALVSTTTIMVTVSSMSDSVLRELLAPCGFDAAAIRKPSKRWCTSYRELVWLSG